MATVIFPTRCASSRAEKLLSDAGIPSVWGPGGVRIDSRHVDQAESILSGRSSRASEDSVEPDDDDEVEQLRKRCADLEGANDKLRKQVRDLGDDPVARARVRSGASSNAEVEQTLASMARSIARAEREAGLRERSDLSLERRLARVARANNSGPVSASGLPSLTQVLPEDLATLGVGKRPLSQAVRSDADGLTIQQGMSPTDARALLAELDAEAARVGATL